MNDNKSTNVMTDRENCPTGSCGSYSGFQQFPGSQNIGRQLQPMQTLPTYLQETTPPMTLPQTGMQQPSMQTGAIPQEGQMLPGALPSAGQMIPSAFVQRPAASQAPEVRFTAFNQIPDISAGVALTAESLQYLNGFLRTQVGRRVRVEFLIGTDQFVDREGILIGVGVNYILINETDTDDITACDFYNIKFVRFYF